MGQNKKEEYLYLEYKLNLPKSHKVLSARDRQLYLCLLKSDSKFFQAGSCQKSLSWHAGQILSYRRASFAMRGA